MKKIETCAIVSSSPTLLDNDYGKIIDQYDNVVRCNKAFVNGYEKYVGSKTNIRFINNHITDYLLNPSYWASHPAFVKEGTWESVPFKTILDGELLIYTHDVPSHDILYNTLPDYEFRDMREFAPYVYAEPNKRFSTGGNAIYTCSNIFEKVDCFCFDFFSNVVEEKEENRRHQVHYFEEMKDWNGGPSHNFDIENKFLKNIDNVNFIN
jgi:hypothetical protein